MAKPTAPQQPEVKSSVVLIETKVTCVVDEIESIRLIGVDTPKTITTKHSLRITTNSSFSLK